MGLIPWARRMTRTARYIATRVLIGLLIGIGMFYFRSAHATMTTKEAMWYISNYEQQEAYFRNTGIDLSGAGRRLPISQQLHVTGVNATATGPIINGNRTLIPPETGRAIKLGETVTIGAATARSIARFYPAVLIASELWDAYQEYGITYDDETLLYTPQIEDSIGTCSVQNIGTQFQNQTAAQCQELATYAPGYDNVRNCEQRSISPPDIHTFCNYGTQPQGASKVNLARLYDTATTYTDGTPVPATDANLDDAWRTGNGPSQADLVKMAVDADASLDLSNETATVTDPLVHQTPHTISTTTRTNPDGSTTTTTRHDYKTVTVATQGEKFGTQTATTTITNNYYITNNNNEIIERNETKNPPPSEAEKEEQEPKLGTFTGKGGTAKTFGSATTDFYDRAKAAPVIAGVSGIAGAIPDTGECPKASFSALGSSFTIESHCTLLDQFYGLIRSVFLLGWMLLAVVVFLRA